MNWRDHITAYPKICHGKHCFRGTRIMVSVVLDCLAAGMTIDSIIAEYPSLSKEAILAALAYSSELAQETRSEMDARGYSGDHHYNPPALALVIASDAP